MKTLTFMKSITLADLKIWKVKVYEKRWCLQRNAKYQYFAETVIKIFTNEFFKLSNNDGEPRTLKWVSTVLRGSHTNLLYKYFPTLYRRWKRTARKKLKMRAKMHQVRFLWSLLGFYLSLYSYLMTKTAI